MSSINARMPLRPANFWPTRENSNAPAVADIANPSLARRSAGNNPQLGGAAKIFWPPNFFSRPAPGAFGRRHFGVEFFGRQNQQPRSLPLGHRLHDLISHRVEAVVDRLKAVPDRLEAPANRLKAGPSRLQTVSNRVETVLHRLEALADRLKAVFNRLEAVPNRL